MKDPFRPKRRPGLYILAILVSMLTCTLHAQLKQKSMLLPSFSPDPQQDDYFGYSVAASRSTVIVGAYLNDTDADGMNVMPDAGAAYIMERNEADEWEVIQKLTPSDRAPGDNFGASVDISRDYALIGASNKTFYYDLAKADSILFAGTVYVYHRNDSGKWVEEQKLFADIPSAYAQFGYAVSLGRSSAFIGAPGEGYDENGENFLWGAGALYSFERIEEDTAKSNYTAVPSKGADVNGPLMFNQKLVAFDRAENNYFGFNVLQRRGNAFGVALEYEFEGSVYPFRRIDDIEFPAGRRWISLSGTPKLTLGENIHPYNFAGEGLAYKKGLLAMGIPGLNSGLNGDTKMHVGGVQLYMMGDAENFVPYDLIRPPAIVDYTYFGREIFLKIINTPYIYFQDPFAEALYYYRMFVTSVLWALIGGDFNMLYPDAGSVNDYRIGYSIQVPFTQEENFATIPKADEIMDVTFLRSITAEDPAAGDNFGFALAASGNELVAGAPLKDFIVGEDSTRDAGAVYFQEICESVTGSMAATVCDSFYSPSGNYVWTTSGIYMDTVTNYIGCDSIITIELTVNSIDNTVSQDDIILEANQADAGYQWLDCDNEYMPVSGATGKTFTPEESGNYAVQITIGECTDTSECHTVNIVGLPSLTDNQLRLYPNPTKGSLYNLNLHRKYDEVKIEIVNSSGMLVSEERYENISAVDIEIDGPAGIYLVRVQLDETIFRELRAIRL